MPPLRFLHSRGTLSPQKVEYFRRLPAEAIILSLRPGEPGALKTRPDGTVLDGHHRPTVLREDGFDVDGLPREIIEKAPDET